MDVQIHQKVWGNGKPKAFGHVGNLDPFCYTTTPNGIRLENINRPLRNVLLKNKLVVECFTNCNRDGRF